MTYVDEVLADSPWVFLEQTETAGTTLADSSGNGRNMTIKGSPTLGDTGPDGGANAIAYAAGSGWAETSATITQPTVGSCEAWVYLSSVPTTLTHVIAPSPSGGTSGGVLALQIEANTGSPLFFYYDGANQWLVGASALSLNTWHHLVGSIGPDGSKLRVNKVEVDSGAATSAFNTGATCLVRTRGYYNGASLQLGGAVKIAYPAFYTTQLSDTRTDVHYDAMVGGHPATGLTLAETLPALQETLTLRTYVRTSTANAINGRRRSGYALVADNTDPAILPDDGTERRDKAFWYPIPDLVDGRPT